MASRRRPKAQLATPVRPFEASVVSVAGPATPFGFPVASFDLSVA
jgi:hypothetical protein